MKTSIKILVLVCSVFVTQVSFSQTLSFCRSVEAGSANSFNIAEGGSILMAIHFNAGATTSHLQFEINQVVDGGSENYYSSIGTDVDYGVSAVNQPITFYNAGTYKVYVYDDSENVICSGVVSMY